METVELICCIVIGFCLGVPFGIWFIQIIDYPPTFRLWNCTIDISFDERIKERRERFFRKIINKIKGSIRRNSNNKTDGTKDVCNLFSCKDCNTAAEIEFEPRCQKAALYTCICVDNKLYVPLIEKLPAIPLNFRMQKGNNKKYIRLETAAGESVCYALLIDQHIPSFYHGQRYPARSC